MVARAMPSASLQLGNDPADRSIDAVQGEEGVRVLFSTWALGSVRSRELWFERREARSTLSP